MPFESLNNPAITVAEAGRFPTNAQPPQSLILEDAPATTITTGGDDFAGTAGTTLSGRQTDLGTTQTWSVQTGTWTIDGSGGVAPTDATDRRIAIVGTVAAYATAFTAQVTSTYHVSGSTANAPGLIVRWVDINNHWYLNPNPVSGYFALYQKKAGTDTLIARVNTPSGIVDGSPITLRIDIWGRDITCFLNGTELFTFTSSDVGLGSTIIGLRQGIISSYPTPVTFSNLLVTTYAGIKYNVPRIDTLPSTQILTQGPAGSWEAGDINNPNVVWDPANRRWVLYYSGYSGSGDVVQGLGLAYADSLDGPWVKDSRNPIVPASSTNIENGALVWSRGRWVRCGENGTGSSFFTSPDLITWTPLTANGLTTPVHDPFLRVNQNGLLELFYGNGSPSAAQIFKATSADGGTTWNAPTTPILTTPPFWSPQKYRGNGEPSVYVPPGKEGTEMLIFLDVSQTVGQSYICGAFTVDGGTTWHWRNFVGGSGTGFDSYQKFDSYPVFAEGAFHVFHAGATLNGTGVGLNTTLGHMSVQYAPNPVSSVSAPVSYQ